MLSNRKDKLLQILAKFPQMHIEEVIDKIKKDTLTLHDFFLQINIKEDMEKCKKDFIRYQISYLNYYLTMQGIHELSSVRDNFFLTEMEEKPGISKELSMIDFSKTLPISLYHCIPIHETFRHNKYWDIYNDIKDVHCIAYREPHFRNFTETTRKFNGELCHLMNSYDDASQLYLYLLANLHHHLNMFFDPKVKCKLHSILDVFKQNRFTHTGEIYVAKNLLKFIKRVTNPEFMHAIKDSDFEVMVPFGDQLHQNFSEFYSIPQNLKKICKKILSKEWSCTTKLLNVDGKNTKLIEKLVLKIAALDYFRDLILSEKNISKAEILTAIHMTFGKDIFDSSFLGKTNLEKRIDEWDKIAHTSKPGFFKEEKPTVPTQKLETAEFKYK